MENNHLDCRVDILRDLCFVTIETIKKINNRAIAFKLAEPGFMFALASS